VNRVVELFGYGTASNRRWADVVQRQRCPYSSERCFKVRKSDPGVSIGTCSVRHGRHRRLAIICPNRFLAHRQIFIDCLHLLSAHRPGDELHVVSEVRIPGGSVDYFLISVRGAKAVDFVGIEVQALDTTGTIWPERQRLLRQLGAARTYAVKYVGKSFGINWKHTAKTTLVQLHPGAAGAERDAEHSA